MNKKQISKTVYTKPEIEVMHLLIESHLLDASYPGDHNKGNHGSVEKRWGNFLN